MYTCVGRRRNNRGVYVEYDIKDEKTGKVRSIPAEDIREYLKSGKNVQGLKLSSDNRILLNYKLDNFEVYTGDILRRYRHDRVSMKKRYAVKSIYNFCIDGAVNEKICGVVGLRGTGKTIALLHTIDELNDYNNTVYIEIKQEISMEELITIVERYKDLKYIFIDEITRVRGFMENAHILSSRYASFGTKIIISGTDSYAIQNTLYDALCHRVELVRMGYISFEEQNMLEDISIDEYIKYGGILDKSVRFDENSKSVIERFVIENIVNSIVRNIEYYKKRGLLPMEYLTSSVEVLRVAIRTTVFYLYYMIILKSIQGVQYLRLKRYTDLGVISSELERSFLDNMGITESVDGRLLVFVLNVMSDMNLIKKVGRYGVVGEYRYYITTPAIAYRLYYDYIQYTNTDKSKTKTVDDLFESIVMCELLNITHEAWYYILDNGAYGNEEIDAVCSLDNDKIVLIEAKSSNNLGRCKKRARSLISCDLDNIAERVMVLRKDFDEVGGVNKCVVKSSITTEGDNKLVQNEVLLTHFSKFKEVLLGIYNGNRSDESDLFREDWKL